MTMTVAGHYKIPYEEAEVLKTTPEKENSGGSLGRDAVRPGRAGTRGTGTASLAADAKQ